MRKHAPAPPLLGATGFSQQEVLEDEIAFASDKWPTANTACQVLKDRLRSSFDLDEVIKRLAIRARK